jgi:heme-degrading monooxygenase HmoA
MIEIVWEFVVKEESRGHFELTYGPGGPWSKLFAICPGFRGTTLLRDVGKQCRYLTVDIWDTIDQWERALAENKADYADLEATFADWTDSRNKVGIFRVQAESTVRPHSKARQGKAGQVRKRRR